MPQKGLDHCVHLIGNFELIEVSGTDSPAIDDVRQPLRHQMRWIARRCCCQMEGRPLALGGNGTTVEFESPPYGIGSHMARRGQHHRRYVP